MVLAGNILDQVHIALQGVNALSLRSVNAKLKASLIASLKLQSDYTTTKANPKFLAESREKNSSIHIGFGLSPANEVGLLYLKSVFGIINGQVLIN